jgi:hypothetical protein
MNYELYMCLYVNGVRANKINKIFEVIFDSVNYWNAPSRLSF